MADIVNSIESLDKLIEKVRAAQEEFATFSQEKVDAIFKEVALQISKRRIPLAKMAVEETGMGIVEDKIIKNHFAAEYIYNKYKNVKTCGVLERDSVNGIMKIASPVGVIAGIIPTTNPTSTAIFKTLIALKTRNGIVFSPHPRAKNCTVETLKEMLEVAVKAGAPKNIIGWIDEPSIELSQALMNHRGIDLILATGGPAMVKAAYSSGTPSIGVGAGNVPAVIDETADIQMAVSSILLSKTFDNGTICASEQSVIVVDSIYDEVKKEFLKRGAYILNTEEAKKLAKTMVVEGKLNAAIAGQPAYKIAEMAGLKVAKETKVLIGEVEKVGLEEPFSFEKLSPVLAMYKVKDYKKAFAKADELVKFAGIGHTSAFYTNPSNTDRIDEFGELMKTGRILINTPSAQGGIGDLYNFRLEPSLTLGCGSWGKNSVSENIGVKHLINIKTVAERSENMLWFKVPEKVYFKKGSVQFALKELQGKKKALIITDKVLFQLKMTDKITNILEETGIHYTIFSDVEPDPTLSLVNRGLKVCNDYQPDVIIALGGGSPIDAAKVIWLLYENPDMKFEDIATRFMDIRKRIYELPKLGAKAQFVCIPTTSGTGSEVTPFAIITDDINGNKYPLADYAFTPNMAVVDPDLVKTMPKGLAAASGIDVLTHALEAYVSVMASPFTDGLALKAAKIIFDHLAEAVNNKTDYAVEQVHYAATMAGMAFSNAFLGICHSMAHKLGNRFNIAHGIANAYCICQVIRFNASDAPTKQTIFPQYKYPYTKDRYAEVADYVGIKGQDSDEKVENLIKKIAELKEAIGIKPSIKEHGIAEEDFMKAMEDLPELAYDDQCTGANPRMPLISELKELFIKAYNGDIKSSL